MSTLLSRDQIMNDLGALRAKGLIWENTFNIGHAYLTMRNEDYTHKKSGRVLLSLPRLYREYVTDDPTEYALAIALFGDWSIWENFTSTKANQGHLEKLRHEAAIARKSQAFQQIALDATNPDSRSRITSAKYLIEEPWNKGVTPQDGRAKRASVRDTANAAFEDAGLKDDLERLKEQGHLN